MTKEDYNYLSNLLTWYNFLQKLYELYVYILGKNDQVSELEYRSNLNSSLKRSPLWRQKINKQEV